LKEIKSEAKKGKKNKKGKKFFILIFARRRFLILPCSTRSDHFLRRDEAERRLTVYSQCHTLDLNRVSAVTSSSSKEALL